MNARVTDTRYRNFGKLAKTGQTPQLPLGARVETPCLVDAQGIPPTTVPDIPPQLLALMRTQINVQKLVGRALMDETPDHIYHGAMMDPHTAAEFDLRQIRSLVIDLLTAHGDWIPTWAHSKKPA